MDIRILNNYLGPTWATAKGHIWVQGLTTTCSKLVSGAYVVTKDHLDVSGLGCSLRLSIVLSWPCPSPRMGELGLPPPITTLRRVGPATCLCTVGKWPWWFRHRTGELNQAQIHGSGWPIPTSIPL